MLPIQPLSNYSDAVKGVRLPQVIIDKKEYDRIGISHSVSNYEFLKRLVWHGLKKIGKEKDEIHLSQIKKELSIFNDLGFVDYFLLLWDIINYAKSNGIPVHKGRGSAASSVVLYCMGITGLDPIKNDLIFERFISYDRVKVKTQEGDVKWFDGGTCPDVDTDFSKDRRDEVLAYISNKYNGKCSYICNYLRFKPKMTITDAAKIVANYHQSESLHLSSLVGDTKHLYNESDIDGEKGAYQSNEKFREWCDKNPKIFSIARKIEGLNKATGVHAAGVLVSYEKIEDTIPLSEAVDNDGVKRIVSAYEMIYAGQASIKLDILGLETLGFMQKACDYAGIKEEEIDLYAPESYQHFQDFKHGLGTFQVGEGLTNLCCQKIKPKNLNELTGVVSISRPGAIAFLDSYSKYTNHGTLTSLHPFLDEILAQDGNCFLYQESVLKIANKIGFTMPEAYAIMKGIAKKDPVKLLSWKEKIFKKCEDLDDGYKIAEILWKLCEDSGAYLFCKCLDGKTLVKKKDEEIFIKDIKTGDYIQSYNLETRCNEYVKVLNVFENVTELYEFFFSDETSIICSLSHKFLTAGGWMLSIQDAWKQQKCVAKNNRNAAYIKYMRFVGLRPTYDIEVDSPFHNFYANDFVVSNSHGASYAALSLTTTYVKHHYPLEFYCAYLNTVSFDKASSIFSEICQQGIKILPPSIKHANTDFIFEKDKKIIRFGFKQLKGVKDASLDRLLQWSKCSFNTFYDLLIASKEYKISIKTLFALIMSGCLDEYDFDKSRCRLLLAAQVFYLLSDVQRQGVLDYCISNNSEFLSSIKIIFENKITNAKGKLIFTESTWKTFYAKYEDCKQVFLFNKQDHLFTNWFFEKKFLGYNHSVHLSQAFQKQSSNCFCAEKVLSMPKDSDFYMIGTLKSVIEKKSKKNDKQFLKGVLNDETGSISFCFMDSQKRASFTKWKEKNIQKSADKKWLADESIVIVSGKTSDGICFLSDIEILEKRVISSVKEI